MVGRRGVEPPIPHGRRILSPLHIPVLPSPHKRRIEDRAPPLGLNRPIFTSTIANFFSSQLSTEYDIVPRVMTPRQPFVALWYALPHSRFPSGDWLIQAEASNLYRIVKAGLILYPDLTYGLTTSSRKQLGVFTAPAERAKAERKRTFALPTL